MRSISIPLDEKIDNIKLDIEMNKICIDENKIQLLGLGINLVMDGDTLVITSGEYTPIVKTINDKKEVVKVVEVVNEPESAEEPEIIPCEQVSIVDTDETKGKERDQLKINRARDYMRDRLIKQMKNQLGNKTYEITKASIRDHNANILVERRQSSVDVDEKNEPMKVKILYSKDYSPMNKDVISGYFTLDYKRYDDSDFYLFTVENNEEIPEFIIISRPVMQAILLKKKGKGSIYRFNIKINNKGNRKEVYDTADLLEGENKVDLLKYYKNLQIVNQYDILCNVKRNLMDLNNCLNFEFVDNIDVMMKKINGIGITSFSSYANIVHDEREINLKVCFVYDDMNAYISDKDLEEYDMFIFMISRNNNMSYYSFNNEGIKKVINTEGKYTYAVTDDIVKQIKREGEWDIDSIIENN